MYRPVWRLSKVSAFPDTRRWTHVSVIRAVFQQYVLSSAACSPTVMGSLPHRAKPSSQYVRNALVLPLQCSFLIFRQRRTPFWPLDECCVLMQTFQYRFSVDMIGPSIRLTRLLGAATCACSLRSRIIQ